MKITHIISGALLVCCVQAQSFCPDPEEECLKHRLCSFGSLDFYNRALEEVTKLTACEDCSDVCASCNCSNFHTSEISYAVENASYCSKSEYCNKPEVTFIMNYLVNNFDTCEAQVLRIQPFLIQLCGTVGGKCCNGQCSQQYQITIPPSMCDQNKGTPAFIRWMLTAYIALGTFLWFLSSIYNSASSI